MLKPNLDHAMQPIIDEMFRNGPEEGCKIWEDPNHPLTQAIAILHRASIEVRMPEITKEATMLLEQHRRLEESAAYGL